MTITKELIGQMGLSTSLDCLMVEAAICWLDENTKIFTVLGADNVDSMDSLKCLPASVKIFIQKYCEVMSMGAGVASESISGMSQSFNSVDKGSLLWQYAVELLRPWLKSQVKIIPAVRKW